MGREIGNAEKRKPGLLGSQHFTGSAQPQIFFGDAKTIFSLAHDSKACLGRFPKRLLIQQQAS